MTGSRVVDDVSTSTLRDGATVSLRRLESTDIDAVIALHDTLTDRERYLRFFTMHPVYLKNLADELTNGNSDHYALGAFESGTLIGVHLCEPGTTRVGPFVSVMSSSITIELTTRQSVGDTRGTSLCSGC